MRAFLLLHLAVIPALATQAFAADHRPRIVISSDFPPLDAIPGGLGRGPPEKLADRDDIQSMVRFLVHANEFRVEGLVVTSSTNANVARKQNLLDMLAVYDRVDENLRRHDPRFPSAGTLRAITWEGRSGTWGRPAEEILGEKMDSEASKHLEDVIVRGGGPLWFCSWGGSRELAQALLQLRRRAPDELPKVLASLHVYLIDDQDGSGPWLRREFPQLFIITSKKTFTGLSYLAPGCERQLGDRIWINAHVRNEHGALGAVYPESGFNPVKFGVLEGDTPSFLYVLSASIGVGDLEHPEWGGWGGRFVRTDPALPHYFDAPEGTQSVSRWQPRINNEFAARMEWCVQPFHHGNHPPMVRLNGDDGAAVLQLDAAPNSEIELSAEGSSDPDGQSLAFHWWTDVEAGGAGGDPITFSDSDQLRAKVRIPSTATGERHVILEVSDSGVPRIVRYRRVVLRILPQPRLPRDPTTGGFGH